MGWVFEPLVRPLVRLGRRRSRGQGGLAAPRAAAVDVAAIDDVASEPAGGGRRAPGDGGSAGPVAGGLREAGEGTGGRDPARGKTIISNLTSQLVYFTVMA